jgi:hypothetical protein
LLADAIECRAIPGGLSPGVAVGSHYHGVTGFGRAGGSEAGEGSERAGEQGDFGSMYFHGFYFFLFLRFGLFGLGFRSRGRFIGLTDLLPEWPPNAARFFKK